MRKTLLLYLLALLCAPVAAGPVSQEQAAAAARQYLLGHGVGHRAVADLHLESRSVARAGSLRGHALLYAVTVGDGDGYVLVSGDDRMRPVLGYVDHGTFDEQTLPPALQALIDGYGREMTWLDARGYEPQQRDGHRAAEVKSAISPLIETHWDQGSPYYYYCPIDTDGRYSVVGCAATALAQVIYYHGMRSDVPTTLLENIPAYTTRSKKLEVPEIGKDTALVAWSEMQHDYNSSLDLSGAGVRAVSKLMQCCGSAIEMNYSSSSSGAASDAFDKALKRYWGFDASTRWVSRSYYSIADWTELIYGELKAARPVLYSGQSDGGGHGFIIDGYDGDELFHVNWGWSGGSDGYFALTVLNPGDNSGIGASSTSDGYSFGQNATIGIQYGTGAEAPAGEPSTAIVTTPDLTATLTMTTTGYMSEQQTVEASLSNRGDEYYGVLYLFASNTETKGKFASRGGITIVRGGTASCALTFTPTSAGEWTLWLTTDADGENVIGQTTVEIGVNGNAPTGPMAFTSIAIAGVDESSWSSAGGQVSVNAYTNSLTIRPRVKNISGATISRIRLWFSVQRYDEATEAWSEVDHYEARSTLTDVAAGQGYNYVEMPFGELGYGQYRIVLKGDQTDQSEATAYQVCDARYYVTLKNGYLTLDKSGRQVYADLTGSDVTVPGDVVAVDLTTVSLGTVTPNSNPNTLYYLSSEQETPASLEGKNIVKDGAATQIVLTDGYPYGALSDVVAGTVSYTRTFSSFYNAGKNWTTLVLPFAASEVRNDEKALTWEVSNRKLWILRYDGDSDDNIYFDTATSPLEANTPYIIALPGSDMGSFSLEGHSTLTFTATDVTLKADAKLATTGYQYKFVGNTLNLGEQTDIYALNAAGDTFKKGDATIEPFRAYFVNTSMTPRSALHIAYGPAPTLVESITASPQTATDGAVYTLAGQRVAQPGKGLYIKNGKKIIIR